MLAVYLGATAQVAVELSGSDPSDIQGAAARLLGALASKLTIRAGTVWMIADDAIRPVASFPPDQSPPEADDLIAAAMAGGVTTGVLELLLPDAWVADPDLLGGLGAAGVALAQFVARSHAESLRRRSDAVLAAQVNASPDGILVVGSDGRIISINRRLAEMAGASTAGMVGADVLVARQTLTERALDPAGVLAQVDAIRVAGGEGC